VVLTVRCGAVRKSTGFRLSAPVKYGPGGGFLRNFSKGHLEVAFRASEMACSRPHRKRALA
jgi:hypothetical protein